MKRFLSTKLLIATLALLAGSIAVTATERPFAANGKGVVTFILEGSGNPIGAEIIGSGNATDLGLFTNTGRVLFTPDPNNPIIVRPSGDGTFTAANGDKLYFTVQDGELNVSTGIGTGHFNISGGTGRFANASGILAFVIEQNLLSGGYEVTIVGSIDY